jgi:hypothetical protein
VSEGDKEKDKEDRRQNTIRRFVLLKACYDDNNALH